MNARSACTAAGFTLIEVLVALAIIAIALLAAMRAAAMGADSVTDLRARMFAGWIAQDRLALHRARGDWLPLGTERGTARQAGIAFAWREKVGATPNDAFRRVDVEVAAVADPGSTLCRLTGFVVHPQ